jgi:hypothetical protein
MDHSLAPSTPTVIVRSHKAHCCSPCEFFSRLRREEHTGERARRAYVRREQDRYTQNTTTLARPCSCTFVSEQDRYTSLEQDRYTRILRPNWCPPLSTPKIGQNTSFGHSPQNSQNSQNRHTWGLATPGCTNLSHLNSPTKWTELSEHFFRRSLFSTSDHAYPRGPHGENLGWATLSRVATVSIPFAVT